VQDGQADFISDSMLVVTAAASGSPITPNPATCATIQDQCCYAFPYRQMPHLNTLMHNAKKMPAPAASSRHSSIVARSLAACLAILTSVLLAGCARTAGPTAAEMNAAYEQVLEVTAPPKSAVFVPASPEEQAALARLESYFASMTPASVRDQTAVVYAPDAWLYDNLAIVSGADAIEKYFTGSVADTRALSVEFLQVIHDGPDYFVRWRMSVEAEALNDGQPMVSYGMTQFRFDGQGRVLVHRDFWDAATGLYEYLPGFGGILRSLRSRLADHAG
jgi:steroid delta-isomerase